MATNQLDLVRKFLEENNLYAISELLRERCDRVHGAKVFDGIQVAMREHTTATYRHTQWDSDGYFSGSEPSRLTVPAGLGGRYFVQVAVRWRNPDSPPLPPPAPEEAHYYTYLSLNGSQGPAGSDARATANTIKGVGFSTTQHFTFETNLSAGDYLEVRVWQDFEPSRWAEITFQMRRIGC